MKRRWMLATLMIVLAGCRGSAVPGGGRCNKGLCVKIEVVEPIRWQEPIGVAITVTAEKDISNLQISLTSYPPVFIEDQGKWVKEGTRMNVNITANRPLVIVRKVRLPAEGMFELIAGAYTPNLPYVSDSVRIYLTREGGVVNPTPAVFSGTPALVPTMPLEWLRTPFPTPTPLPTLPLSPLATPTREGSPFRSPPSTPTSAEHP